MSVSQRAFGGSVPLDLFRRDRVVAAALGLVAVFLAFLIFHDVFFPAAPANENLRLASVVTGTVRSQVSGTGTVGAMQQGNLTFSGVSGTLTEVDVKLGDQVKAGQVLARIDPATYQQALDQANNNLTSAQATLNATLAGNDVVQAQHALDQARQSYTDTVNSVNLTNQQDQATLDADTRQRDADQQTYNNTCTVPQPPATCAQLAQTVAGDNQKVTADQNKQAVDRLSGQRQTNQAQNGVTNAQDTLNSRNAQRPATIAQQQSAVANAQVAVQTAQRNVNNTTLVAPFDGLITVLNAQVGDNVSGGSAASSSQTSSSQSSGTGGAGGAGGSGATGSSSSTSSTSSALMTLSNISGLQVVVPFAEADAARLQAGQQATITFDAVSGLSLAAHVLSVANIATVVSNVTNYSTTLVLDSIDQRLKLGMTANVTVTVQQAANVLVLSNSAITRVAGTAFVTVLDKDGKQARRQVQTGVVGDSTTEILSGLAQGDRVVLPQLRTTTGTTGGGRAPGGGGGGGGVRIGGGG